MKPLQSSDKQKIYTKFKDHHITKDNLPNKLITERSLERALKLKRMINSKRL